MKYINARDVLPDDLVSQLQRHIQGAYVYVPACGARRRWGEASGYRAELDGRNRAIAEAFRAGAKVERLAAEYGLSESAIRKIVYGKG